MGDGVIIRGVPLEFFSSGLIWRAYADALRHPQYKLEQGEVLLVARAHGMCAHVRFNHAGTLCSVPLGAGPIPRGIPEVDIVVTAQNYEPAFSSLMPRHMGSHCTTT